MLSERAKRLKPSPTMALNSRAQELMKSGRDIVSFAIGEPDWDTFEGIKKVAHQALDAGLTKYISSAGLPELRKAVVDRLKIDLDLSYEPAECTIGLGAKQTIFNALQVLCDPGDEVIVPAPFWVSYPTMVELADAKPIIATCPKETSFKLTPDVLKRSLTAKTKVLILNSPNNPTGQVYSVAELRDIAAVLERTAVWVISDDIYDKMIFDGSAIAPHIAQQNEKMRPRVLLANSVSKTYSMTGWRVGSLVGNRAVIDACSNYQSQSASCGVPFAQKAAASALNGPQDEVLRAMGELKTRRDIAFKLLSSVDGFEVSEPQGAFYMWPYIAKTFGKTTPDGRAISNSGDFARALLDLEGVAVVPGSDFGTEGYVRLCYTVNQARLKEGLTRIKRFAETLK